MRHREELGEFLNTKGLVGVGAVVGDTFPQFILDTWKGQKLYEDARIEDCLDESLDFVYLDKHPGYSDVLNDLRSWYPKIRPGGMMSGHKFLDGVAEQGVFSVASAVYEFCQSIGCVVQVTNEPHLATWYFFKPRKVNYIGRPNVCVLTEYDDNVKHYSVCTVPNKAVYCVKHGYTFICEGPGGFVEMHTKSAYWNKILFIQKHLPHYDWVFWTDADSLIMNQSMALDRLIDSEVDFVISHEQEPAGIGIINAGHMLIKNSTWSFQFLQEILEYEPAWDHPFGDNQAILELIAKNGYPDNVKLIAQRHMNSYPDNYEKGDFIVHLVAGWKHDLRHFQAFSQFVV